MENVPSEGNVYSLHPQEVQFADNELERLATDVRTAIDESFLFANYNETFATVRPLELFAPTTQNNTYVALTSGMPYDRAHVEMTINHDDDDAYLQDITARLYRQEWRTVGYSVLHGKADDRDIDDEDKQEIHPENPDYYISSPVDLRTMERERTPLNYSSYRELLNHVVSLANPVASITNSDRNLLESAEALMAVSSETSLSRSTKYRIYMNDHENIEVGVHDRALVYPIGEPKHMYHEVNVKRVRLFGKAGSLATMLHMRASGYETQATIAKEYTYSDDTVNDIEQHLQEITEEHHLMPVEKPQEFGRQILESIHLLKTVPTRSDIVQLDT